MARFNKGGLFEASFDGSELEGPWRSTVRERSCMACSAVVSPATLVLTQQRRWLRPARLPNRADTGNDHH